MNEPLSGIRVVDMTLAVQGPAASLYLRDMGAEVIKVEPPIGDPSRYGRGHANETPVGTLGPQFVAVNRGKRSVCVDLSTELGRNAVLRLLETADVFLTNYREPALVKMGLGYDALHARFPRLIYASVNGFGPTGVDADKAMLDGAAVARGGLAHMTGYPDDQPLVLGAIVGDTAGAMHLALATMTALFARERTGIAQRVQTSALGTQLWLQQWELTHTAMTGAKLKRSGPHHPNIKGPYGIYRTSCGGAIMLAQTMLQDAWDAICIFADMPELAIDPRMNTPAKRLGEGITEQDSREVRQALTEAFARKTAAEWDEFLRTQPEAIWERVRNWDEVLEDEQSVVNGYVVSIEVPGFGPTKTVGNLVTLSETPGSVKGGPPVLGEGNAEILAEVGMTAGEIEEIGARATSVRDEAFALIFEAQKQQ
jgi:crotonobetainyl-CoA:carnitine CoA-transferase CaiB-like acyl-CoA transferase